MLKKFLIIVTLFILLILIYKNTLGNEVFRLNMEWNINLPQPDEVMYTKSSSSGIHGDGVKYYAFLYNSKSKQAKLKKIKWNDDKSFNSQIFERWIPIDFNIDENYKFDFTDDYLYYYKVRKNETESLIIIYQYEKNIIYVLETIL